METLMSNSGTIRLKPNDPKLASTEARVGVEESDLAPVGRKPRRARPGWEIVAEKAIEGLILLCGISAVLFVFGIFFFVFREGVSLLFAERFSLIKFLFSTEWFPTSQSNVRYGVLALFVGTASVTGLAMLMAVPFGLGAAIFLAEFCNKRTKETLKIIVELLAAIPSVVWGFIGISLMNPLIQKLFHVPIGLNVFNGALLLALMSVPIMVSIGEDALKAVPDSYREASIAMGATKWQVIYRVLLPAAKNGLLAAVLLGVGRAVGETMAVLMATGHAVNIPLGPFDPVRTLTATIAAELGETAAGSDHYQVLFIIGILLFTITFVVNLTADMVVKGIRKGA
jgi:phosphate transport system permease protein